MKKQKIELLNNEVALEGKWSEDVWCKQTKFWSTRATNRRTKAQFGEQQTQSLIVHGHNTLGPTHTHAMLLSGTTLLTTSAAGKISQKRERERVFGAALILKEKLLLSSPSLSLLMLLLSFFPVYPSKSISVAVLQREDCKEERTQHCRGAITGPSIANLRLIQLLTSSKKRASLPLEALKQSLKDLVDVANIS